MENMSLIRWLSINAIPEVRVVDNTIDYFWCLRIDAENAWDYINDDRLKWYTCEQMLEIYNKKIGANEK